MPLAGYLFAIVSASAILASVSAMAELPTTVQCPDRHPSNRDLVLVAAAIKSADGGEIERTTISVNRRRDARQEIRQFEVADSDKRVQGAKLDCVYGSSESGEGRDRFEIAIPGVLWRCDFVEREKAPGTGTVWARCVSLPVSMAAKPDAPPAYYPSPAEAARLQARVAAEPTVTRCPDRKPDAEHLFLEAASIRFDTDKAPREERSVDSPSGTARIVQIYPLAPPEARNRRAILECVYAQADGRKIDKVLELAIPGVLWRCDQVVSVHGTGMRHFLAGCISLPE